MKKYKAFNLYTADCPVEWVYDDELAIQLIAERDEQIRLLK